MIIPLWNEAESLPILFRRLSLLVMQLPIQWEFVFVDDGSTDATRELLLKSMDTLPNSKLVFLARNFGQQAAYRAGLDHVQGEAVIFLDGDLQDPPERIPDLIQEWKKGAKVVIGVRESRKETGFRRLCFDVFHQVFFRMTRGSMPKNSGTFGLIDRVVAEHLKKLSEINLFLPALRCWFGYPTASVYYQRDERAAGKAKQSYFKLFSYALDGITSFSEVPLRLITLVGFIIALPSFLYGSALLSIRILQSLGFFKEMAVHGFTTLAVAIFFIGGIQMLCLGVLGEYIARIYRETKHRPHFIVEIIHQPSRENS